jgi:alkanesulfonate monooxygenase SsuD/methylene tetrahydromethanopterin reductase-like flavin-dependent oxidoreductase (luciferase family)
MDPDDRCRARPATRRGQERIIAMGKRGMTIRQIGRVLAMSQAHRVLYGTPKSLADDMQAWLEAGACDGFNLLFAHYPKPLEEWVTMVIPELQRRGIFRTQYEGKTFRENLGVPIPQNVHQAARVQVNAAASNDQAAAPVGLQRPGNHLPVESIRTRSTSDMDFQQYVHITQVAEAAKFDTIFFQDTVGVGQPRPGPWRADCAKLSRTVKLEPTATWRHSPW